MNNILLLTLFQIILMQNSFAFKFHNHRPSFQTVVLNLKPGDVIDVSGYLLEGGTVTQHHFDLETAGCDWYRKNTSSCNIYNVKLDFGTKIVTRRLFKNGGVAKRIDEYKPLLMNRGRFRYVLKAKATYFEMSFNNQILPNWNYDIPLEQIETFTLYGELIADSFKIHRGYSVWLIKDYKGVDIDVECN